MGSRVVGLAASLAVCVFALPTAARECVVDVAAESASDEGPGTPEQPLRTIGKAAELAAPGDTISVRPGVYREAIKLSQEATADQPLVLRGDTRDGEVVLTGVDVIDGWERLADEERPIWMKRQWTHVWCGWNENMSHGAEPPIGRCEQVVYRDELLAHVLALDEMQPGTFVADPKGEQALYVWLPDGGDPNGVDVQVAVRNALLVIEGAHIEVSGLTLRYAANSAQHGALEVLGAHNKVSDCLVEWTNGSGVSFRGEGHQLIAITSQHNGQMGMGGGGVDCLLVDCALLHNNVKGFPSGWEAGGIKVTHALRTDIRRMTSIGNGGTGIWYDIDNRECEISECWVEDNADSGIFIEISGRGGINVHDNICIGNGTGGNWAASGISLGESTDCEVHHNLCIGNPTGIGIREQGPRTFPGRDDGADVTYHNERHHIHHNICTMNERYQFGLWYDNVFFGPHPSPEVGARGTPLDPADSELRVHDNLLWPGEDQGLVLWGCPWRDKHQVFDDLAAYRLATGLGAGSRVADPMLADPEQGRYELDPSSPAIEMGAGLTTAPAGMDRVVAH